MTYVK